MFNLVATLKFSRYQIILLALLVFSCGVAVLVADLPIWAQALLIVSLLVVVLIAHIGERKKSVAAVVKQNDEWWLVDGQGDHRRVALLGHYSTPWLVILRFAKQGKAKCYRQLIIWPDSLPNQQFKSLRVALRQAIL